MSELYTVTAEEGRLRFLPRAMALGRLGKMISYARYSADIFAENMLDDDD